MKTFKLFTAIAFTAILGFTSCQSEENSQVGTNPNANSSTSPTASNYERAAKNDGSDDDFLDGNSCTELLFPLTAAVNGQSITIISKLDFSAVLNIMGEFNDDSDVVTFQFPIRVITSSHTQVTLQSQSDLDELKEACESAEEEGNDAISCVEIDFPITMLTYNVSIEQTGSVVIQSQQQLYTFMSDLQSDELFSVNYPMNVTASNGTSIQIGSDAEFQSAISDCLQTEEEEEEAAESAVEVEAILSGSIFKVETFITGGVETANDYADYTIEFTNDLKIVAKNQANATLDEIEGTYTVSSEIEVFVDISFASNTAVSALGNDFIVSAYSDTVITLTSKTDASVTLAFKKI
ncbi:hypothetical protein BTO04_10130 [Polaribacter sp. SA4-10]|uniref:hypothetical protein n=1 Tax=Polaribacter sp. SA4-10 TaxID=754397 RepID=UPI000B3C7814|nr:hypothetical protein [Polaribacter sp. SA4-10]ARV07023.1 hypothetical protein BTO04_10130 [Polaribacter sp. SA4-10]